MKRIWWLMMVSLTMISQRNVFACSCGGAPEVIEALRASDIVVVADVVFSEQREKRAPAGRVFTTEFAKFKIVEVLKGVVEPGGLLEVRSELGPFGPCGVSVRNSPVWLEEVDGTPTVLSTRWLIYGRGEQPFELTLCGRSKPLNVVQKEELQQLRSDRGRISRGVNRTSRKGSAVRVTSFTLKGRSG